MDSQTQGGTAAAIRPDGPVEVSLAGWWGAAKQTWIEGADDNLGLLAAGIAFNAFLATVPLLTVVVLTYGLVTSPEEVARHIGVLTRTLPQDAANLVASQLRQIAQAGGTSVGLGLIASIAIALFGALRGATGLMVALNIAYEVDERRSFLGQTMTAVAITFGGTLTFILASIGVSIANMLGDLLPALGGATQTILKIAFWVLAALCLSLVLAAIYAWAPNRECVKWRWVTPGSAVATLVWIAATGAFSFYVGNFGNYNATYGALGAVIVFLTWLYLSGYIVLLGAELNQVVARRADAKTGS